MGSSFTPLAYISIFLSCSHLGFIIHSHYTIQPSHDSLVVHMGCVVRGTECPREACACAGMCSWALRQGEGQPIAC